MIAIIFTILLPGIFALGQSPEAQPQSPQSPDAPSTIPGPASYDVVSIKPYRDKDSGTHIHVSEDNDSFIATGVSAKYLIELAYEVRDFQISGGPGWADSEKYAISAKMDDETLEALKKLSREQANGLRQLMLQSLLAERFNLKLSHSTKELPIYALLVSKNGLKLSPSKEATGHQGYSSNKRGELTATRASMSSFADRLSRELGRKVVDKTGLQDRYDFTLHWTPERLTPVLAGAADNTQGPAAPALDSSGPTIYTALQEQLGLRLEPQKGPVETLIIESIEKPSEN